MLSRESFCRRLLIGAFFILISVGCRPLFGSLIELIAAMGVLTLCYFAVCFQFAMDDIERNAAQKFVRGGKFWTQIPNS